METTAIRQTNALWCAHSGSPDHSNRSKEKEFRRGIPQKEGPVPSGSTFEGREGYATGFLFWIGLPRTVFPDPPLFGGGRSGEGEGGGSQVTRGGQQGPGRGHIETEGPAGRVPGLGEGGGEPVRVRRGVGAEPFGNTGGGSYLAASWLGIKGVSSVEKKNGDVDGMVAVRPQRPETLEPK